MEQLHHLAIWNRACEFSLASLRIAAAIPNPSLSAQISRCVLAIPAEIADGHERSSVAHFRNALIVARGFCGRVRTQIHLAHQLRYLSERDAEFLIRESIELSISIASLLRQCRRARNCRTRACSS